MDSRTRTKELRSKEKEKCDLRFFLPGGIASCRRVYEEVVEDGLGHCVTEVEVALQPCFALRRSLERLVFNGATFTLHCLFREVSIHFNSTRSKRHAHEAESRLASKDVLWHRAGR